MGGSEIADPRHRHFFKTSVNQLFCDTDGVYSSGDKCDPCILTAIFYDEPTLGRYESDQELMKAYEMALEVSQGAGYDIFKKILDIETDPTPDQLV